MLVSHRTDTHLEKSSWNHHSGIYCPGTTQQCGIVCSAGGKREQRREDVQGEIERTWPHCNGGGKKSVKREV